MPQERLSKLLAACGITSRRKCEKIITDGRVTVNNISVIDVKYKASIELDRITVDNRVINPQTKIYFALYKPIRYLSDLSYEEDRKIARSLIPMDTYLFPVGRLDYPSEGLMIFTNDGALAQVVMHPSYGIEKEYLVKFKGRLTQELLTRLRKGMTIDRHVHKVKDIRFEKPSLANSWYRITLAEGRNRMIRRMGEHIGHPVLKLKRIRIGTVRLGSMAPGQYRSLTIKEKSGLLRMSTKTCCGLSTNKQ